MNRTWPCVQARAKRDAKQLAAAALLELLLESVPFQDLLYKSEKLRQLKDLQVSVNAVIRACSVSCAIPMSTGPSCLHCLMWSFTEVLTSFIF